MKNIIKMNVDQKGKYVKQIHILKTFHVLTEKEKNPCFNCYDANMTSEARKCRSIYVVFLYGIYADFPDE